jgi:G:T-mismatch repair DNA endonuclease (very short patch repair protein)
MEEKIKNCKYCNKEFIYTNKRNIYCSLECKANHSKENKGVIVKKNCKNCNKEFECVGETRVFCSNECRNKYFIKNPIKHTYMLMCNYCGKTFEKTLANKPKENENHYCSQECVGYNKNKIGIDRKYFCKECCKEFSQIHKRHYFCCEGCKRIYSSKHVITKIVFCSMCNKEIERIRSLKRDHFFCSKKCESAFREIEADDIRTCRYCKKEFKCKKHDKLVFCSKACQICGMNNSPTKPHRDIMEIIEYLDTPFEIEMPIKRYSIDIFLMEYGLGIEIMGEYWHCDNRLYDNPKYKAQIDGIKKDRKKYISLKKDGINILYLWEPDIKNDLSMCKKLIMEFIEGCGILDNYHSMNYELKNSELILKNEILIPYFER